MPTRRYEIQLIVNAQQVTQAAQTANQAQQAVQQGATGVAGAIQSAVNSVTAYVAGIQGIRLAWNTAERAMEEYFRQAERSAERQKTAAQKGLDLDSALREY